MGLYFSEWCDKYVFEPKEISNNLQIIVEDRFTVNSSLGNSGSDGSRSI